MKSTAYDRFVKRWEEVTDLPTQSVGPLTPYYKRMTKHLKTMPWPLLVVVSTLFVVAIFLLAGSAVTFLVTLLQRGF